MLLWTQVFRGRYFRTLRRKQPLRGRAACQMQCEEDEGPRANINPELALHIHQGGLILKSSIKAFAAVACLCLLASPAFGQVNQQSNGGLVAVLDVAKVFKQNSVFNQRMDAIKAEAEQFKARMEAEQLKLRQDAERLNDFNPGSAEYKNLESDLEQRTAKLRTLTRQTNNDLLNREAKIYYDTYLQLQQVVSGIAEQYGITLVIRFDSAPIDPTNRGEVVKGVNRNVVYQKNLDLTNMVIEKMKTTDTSSAGVGNNLK